MKSSIISLTLYHPNREGNYNKFNQINQWTTMTLNKRKEIIHIREMRIKKKISTTTPNMQNIRIFKK